MERIIESRLEKCTEKSNRIIEKFGWIIHHVANIGTHTHGVRKTYNLPELEIAFWLPADTAKAIIDTTIEMLKTKEFIPGSKYSEIISNLDVMLINSPDKEDCIRIVIPDQHGCLDKETMVPLFAKQFDK